MKILLKLIGRLPVRVKTGIIASQDISDDMDSELNIGDE